MMDEICKDWAIPHLQLPVPEMQKTKKRQIFYLGRKGYFSIEN